jgi:putative tricarboxylic transport membrane protein
LKLHDSLSGAALIALAAAILWHIQGFPPMPGQKFGPAWFPGLVAAGLGLCGAALVYKGARRSAPWVALPEWMQRSRARAAVIGVLAGLLFYILAAEMLGFHITALAIVALWVRILGASWRVTILVALLAPLVIHLAFYKLLRVPLPWGLLERWAF